MDPVETVSISIDAASPRRITVPAPNCFSICPKASSKAFLYLPCVYCMCLVDARQVLVE